jgi:hypothetical protein
MDKVKEEDVEMAAEGEENEETVSFFYNFNFRDCKEV